MIMKTNKLMIADWVLYEGEPYQIRKLGIYGVDRDGEDYPAVCVGKPTGIGLVVERNEIEPIPLTPEILEKNEFKKFPFFHIDEQHQWSWWENTLISVTLWCRELNDDTKDGMMLKIEAPTSTLCIKVNYVHELQHALRLCGIEKEIVL